MAIRFVYRLFMLRLKSTREYKVDFMFMLLFSFIETIGMYYLLSYLFLSLKPDSFEYNYDVVYFVGCYRVIYGLILSLFYDRVISLPTTVRKGDFDPYLLSPQNTMIYYFFGDVNSKGLPSIIVGLMALSISSISFSLISLLSLFVGIVLSVFFVFNVFASISSVAVNFINPGPLNAVLTNYFSFSQIAHLGVNMNTVYILVLSPFFMTGWFTYGLSVIQDKTFFVLMAVIVVVSQFVRVHSWKHLMKNYVSANL